MQRPRKGNASSSSSASKKKPPSLGQTPKRSSFSVEASTGNPSLNLLRCALMLPLVTLSVILFAGIYAVPHHIPQYDPSSLNQAHPLHQVILQVHNASAIKYTHQDIAEMKSQQRRRDEAEKILKEQGLPIPKKTNGKAAPAAGNKAKDTTSASAKEEVALNFNYTSMKVQYTPKVPSQVNKDSVQYHIVFSSGCSAFQDWQSYLFFFHAWESGQPGHVTRIVSGCKTQKDQDNLETVFNEQIASMAPLRFHIHFTPDFSYTKPGTNYKYFNKPFGTQHWLEHGLNYKQDENGVASDNPEHDDAIVILMDPDQIILRPFTDNDFSQDSWKFLGKNEAPYTAIEHGKPMGQMYGFALQWKTKVTMDHVAKFDYPSPVDNLTNSEAQKGYILGPPYISTARDMYAISRQWSIFAPRVHDQYPHLLAEMFGYSLAAAHLRLPHQTAQNFMVSSITAGYAEGWQYADELPVEASCQPANAPKNFSTAQAQPRVFHLCQRYNWGPYFFGKYRFPKDFLTCKSPLLAEPPPDLLTQYDQSYAPPFGVAPHKDPPDKDRKFPKRHVYSLCTMIFALNQAATYFKQKHCVNTNNGSDEDQHTTNWDKSLVFVKKLELFRGANVSFYSG